MLNVLQGGATGFVHESGTERHLFGGTNALAVHQPDFTATIAEVQNALNVRSKPRLADASRELSNV
jgi:hypothetical protein